MWCFCFPHSRVWCVQLWRLLAHYWLSRDWYSPSTFFLWTQFLTSGPALRYILSHGAKNFEVLNLCFLLSSTPKYPGFLSTPHVHLEETKKSLFIYIDFAFLPQGKERFFLISFFRLLACFALKLLYPPRTNHYLIDSHSVCVFRHRRTTCNQRLHLTTLYFLDGICEADPQKKDRPGRLTCSQTYIYSSKRPSQFQRSLLWKSTMTTPWYTPFREFNKDSGLSFQPRHCHCPLLQCLSWNSQLTIPSTLSPVY